MLLNDFSYDLPKDLIADYPSHQRSQSRLLFLNHQSGNIEDRKFTDICDLLTEKDLLILNNTKVIPARFLGVKDSGGKVEVFIERILNNHNALVHICSNKPLKIGKRLLLEKWIEAIVIEKKDDLFKLHFLNKEPISKMLETSGRIPLPPYIQREAEEIDKNRYQTVYATHLGAVAAPTAGLHFDHTLLDRLKNKGVNLGYITLHVGSGTFQPVRTEYITQHQMHSEYIEVSDQVCAQIKNTKKQGGRVIAVGTTTVRALESAAALGTITPYEGETNIFIFPGYKFRCIDGIVTNFHLPKSTLLMLVCAFAGREQIFSAYQYAIRNHYRFFSYGDAMLIADI
ncbi:tRNA preQ1(34) S-adenosylmethionine ribosyltransferase-isomerase QueA [Candidatus Nitrosacidococcus sp. I8]|uniref:tRNA preQ1(34) S-adenosylmethionine ribosyltransferase-isomerase QueA n=1 Tax=Candidatus Nitrosacidococcus sp. I8 TaxID=2942908 RepID=UPI002225E1DE|nr:tRNA preQ1(34) S-adenosylmethionine ribosyltransferase-isomerase QueA [Candidatus Nitrosacidococcus sp. I8]